MKYYKRFFKHLHTINKHRRLVRKYCFKCGIYLQGLTHDLSKYSPTELSPGVKYYTGLMSPHYGERKDLGYSEAWMHHYGRNRHHPEYWRDINIKTGKYEPVRMPFNYFVEMICDRIAACKIYKGSLYKNSDPLEYFISHKDENQFHKDDSKDLEYYLTVLSNFGENEVFNQLKMKVKFFYIYKYTKRKILK